MRYTIRNIRPSVLHVPDAGLRLDSGQTAVVETLSPQMLSLLEARALEAISHDPAPPTPALVAPQKPVPDEKKSGKAGSAPKTEAHDDTR
ncbi:MAG: hypothetical protein ACYDBB_02615 [Armatimonadota bacterium]